jgi:hypothetical protein
MSSDVVNIFTRANPNPRDTDGPVLTDARATAAMLPEAMRDDFRAELSRRFDFKVCSAELARDIAAFCAEWRKRVPAEPA